MRTPRTDTWLALVIAAFAFVVRVAIDLHGRLAFGDFDEGVYFGNASAFWRGVVPYRDFVSVHPPASVLLFMATTGPITAMAGPRAGFVAARVLAALAGAVTTWLLYRCALHLSGRRAAVLVAVAYATFSAAVFADSRVLLDPFMIVFAVAGASVFLERRSVVSGAVAGVLLGLAVSTKLTGAVFVLAAVAVGLAMTRDRRRTLVLGASTVGTFVVVSLPFVLLAGPGRWFDQVVMAQLDRPTGAALPGNIASLGDRLSAIVAWGPLGGRGTLPLAVTMIGVVVTVTALVWGVDRARCGDVRAAFWTTTAVMAIVGLLVGPTFYAHYAVLAAVPIVVLLGGAASAALDRLARPQVSNAIVAVVVAILVGWQVKVTVLVDPPMVPPGIATAIAQRTASECVLFDQPQVGFLSDVVPQDGIDHPLVDPFGELLELGRARSSSAIDALLSDPSQQRLREALGSCEWVVLTTPPEGQFTWSDATRAQFLADHELKAFTGEYSVWRTRPITDDGATSGSDRSSAG